MSDLSTMSPEARAICPKNMKEVIALLKDPKLRAMTHKQLELENPALAEVLFHIIAVARMFCKERGIETAHARETCEAALAHAVYRTNRGMKSGNHGR
jgi:hypothetical protein